MLDRSLEEEKIFGKNEKEPYSPDIDLWSIGCTLVFIACNTYAFDAATVKGWLFNQEKTVGLKELYAKRGPNDIMGTKTIDGKIEFFKTFRPVSPISKTASSKLQEMYIEIIRECFKPIDKRSYDSILKQIDVLKNEKLCYMIDINQGFGQYQIGEMASNDSKKEYIDHYSKGLKFPVAVRFNLESDQPVETKLCDLYEKPSDPDGKSTTVIKSHCEAIRALFSQTERPHFDINMLKHLCLFECNKKKLLYHKYKKIEEDCMVEYDKKMNEIETRYSEISQIYKDLHKMKHDLDLKPLLKRCEKIEEELKQNLGKYVRVVYGKRDCTGLIGKLISLIVEAENYIGN